VTRGGISFGLIGFSVAYRDFFPSFFPIIHAHPVFLFQCHEIMEKNGKTLGKNAQKFFLRLCNQTNLCEKSKNVVAYMEKLCYNLIC
jgi:hypothetical protein